MAPKPSWILKAPRVLLVVIFPIVSFILYVTLLLGCMNNSLSAVSPIIVSSNQSLNIGGTATRVDMRIGFWGICFGPEPYSCATSLTVVPTKTVADLMKEISPNKGGRNADLVRLGLSLQGTLIIFSGIVLLVILGLDLLANAVEIYFNVGGVRGEHMQASVWARGLDWAAAAGALVGFTTYRSLIGNTQNLLQSTTGTAIQIAGGNVASTMFGAIVGTTAAGALINTFLTAQDAGLYADRAMRAGGLGGGGGGGGGGGSGVGGASPSFDSNPDGDKFRDAMQRRRAAYEAFP